MNELLRQKHEGEESGGLRGLITGAHMITTCGIDPYNSSCQIEVSSCISCKSLESWSRNGGGRVVILSDETDKTHTTGNL